VGEVRVGFWKTRLGDATWRASKNQLSGCRGECTGHCRHSAYPIRLLLFYSAIELDSVRRDDCSIKNAGNNSQQPPQVARYSKQSNKSGLQRRLKAQCSK